VGAFREFDSRNTVSAYGDDGSPVIGDEHHALQASVNHRDPAWLNRSGRRVLLCDMDTFFVSVERLFDPSLIGRPVIVGGPKGARGIVAACSYEAREYGVKSGMALREASRLCPAGEFVHGRGHSYTEWHEKVRGILAQHLPEVKAESIDEFACDVTGMGRIWPSLFLLGQFLRREVYVRTGLPMTIGGGRNGLVAKVASVFAKPDGLFIVPEGGERMFLAPMHVSKLPGIGPKTTEVLERHGIRTLGQLARMPKMELKTRLGKWGLYLWEKANGREVVIYQQRRLPRSIGHESTFRADVDDGTKVAEVLRSLAERAGYRLRKHGLKCRLVTVKLRYHDFDTHTAQTALPLTNVDRVIWPFALSLLGRLGCRRAPVRLVGIRLADLHKDNGQLELFSASEGGILFPKPAPDSASADERNDGSDRQMALPLDCGEAYDCALDGLRRDSSWHDAVDAIRDRYGYEAIGTGPTIKRLIERKRRRAGVGEAGGLEVARPQNMR